jgi:hypothetical protein
MHTAFHPTHSPYRLVPRSRRWLLHHTVELCRACHSGVHSLFDEETLARTHHSLDKLMREEKGARARWNDCCLALSCIMVGMVFGLLCLFVFHLICSLCIIVLFTHFIHLSCLLRAWVPPHSPIRPQFARVSISSAHGQVPGESARDKRAADARVEWRRQCLGRRQATQMKERACQNEETSALRKESAWPVLCRKHI